MFKRIMIASETSPAAKKMLYCLNGLKKLGAKECIIMKCFNPDEISVEISNFIIDILREDLEKQKAVMVSQGYSVETRLVSGCMRTELNCMAEREECSLVVAAAPDQSMLGEYLFGGTAHDVIHYAVKPVLLLRVPVGQDEECADPAEAFKALEQCDLTEHILYATDFSDNAWRAFEYVVKMVESGVKKVTIVHVQDMVKINPHLISRVAEFNEIDAARLQELKKILMQKGCADVDIHLLYGIPAVEILQLIRERKATMTVMGSQGRGFVNEFFLGSVSQNVARHSSSSVLLVPALR